MKRLLSLLLLLFTLNASAQYVAGVFLRQEYNSVKQQLEKRYGYSYSSNHNKIEYKDISIGGINYEWAEFQFVYHSQAMRLNTVEFSYHFKLSELNDAKKYRDYIASVYAKKYEDIVEAKNEDGFKMYGCSYNEDYGRPAIIINLCKSKSIAGETFYYVTVNYGPVYQNDEIDDI